MGWWGCVDGIVEMGLEQLRDVGWLFNEYIMVQQMNGWIEGWNNGRKVWGSIVEFSCQAEY